jgi:uncharacterized protein YdaU (DUF1376 family)
MHYFQFEIKEWVANTAHLTLEEEAAYLRLIFYYYDSERFIDFADASWVFRKCRIPEKLGENILLEFFTRTDDGWVHKRCDAEIARYHAKKEQASKAGKASAERRLNERSTTVQPIINQESLIINQESKKTKPPVVGTPNGVSDSVWSDFLAHRRTKKAKVTQTALDGIAREARKAGYSLEQAIRTICERGWTGFNAEWVANAPKTPVSGNLAAARAIFGDERRLSDDRTIEIDTPKIA